jgi:hypothetical protein
MQRSGSGNGTVLLTTNALAGPLRLRLDAGLVEGPSHEIIPVLDVDRRYAARLNGHCLYCDAAAALKQRNGGHIFECSLMHCADNPSARLVELELKAKPPR